MQAPVTCNTGRSIREHDPLSSIIVNSLTISPAWRDRMSCRDILVILAMITFKCLISIFLRNTWADYLSTHPSVAEHGNEAIIVFHYCVSRRVFSLRNTSIRIIVDEDIREISVSSPLENIETSSLFHAHGLIIFFLTRVKLYGNNCERM